MARVSLCTKARNSLEPAPVIGDESPPRVQLMSGVPNKHRMFRRLLVIPAGDLRPVQVTAQRFASGHEGHSGVDYKEVHEEKVTHLLEESENNTGKC